MFKYLILACCGLTAFVQADEKKIVKMPKKHMAFLDQYCMDCHDADTEKGDFNVEDLPFEIKTIKVAEQWKHVLNSINAGEMPPEDKKQPKPKEKADFLNDLSEVMVEARSSLSDSGGLITMRRLNRREYVNSIDDLLGVRVDASDLPNDQSSFGFDTAGKSLFFSSDQFEQYLSLGETAVEKALAFPKEKPEVKKTTIEVEDYILKNVLQQQHRQLDVYERIMTWKANKHESPTKYGFIDEDRVNFELLTYNRQAHNNARYVTLPRATEGAYLTLSNPVPNVAFKLPNKSAPGRYQITVNAGLIDPEGESFLEFGRGKTNEFDLKDSFKVYGSVNKTKKLSFSIQYEAGESTEYSFRMRMPNNYQNIRRLYFDSVRKTGLGPKPNIFIDSIEVEGPFYDHWPPKSVAKLLPPTEKKWKDDAYAKRVIHNFAMRAFRGKEVSDAYVDRLLKIYQYQKSKNQKFEQAIVKPLAIVLASPSFIYLPEPTKVKPKSRPLSDRELAVRLSYFLWSSAPDDQLNALVESGELSQANVLAKQVERMLMDDRSSAFIAAFCHQWLHMERLNFFQFNTQKYYDFDESAKTSARYEVYKTFEVIMKEKLGLDKLLKSDFVVIDELLSDYYEIPGVKGKEFKKVTLPSGSKRGGLLGMAAVLAMGSDGENSSPVERGSWILRKLLNDPPPPAPPNVPQLGEVGAGMTKREMLSVHTQEPQCAQCHRKIDPIGFGLENFNAAGKWIENEIVKTQVIDEERSTKKKKKYKTINKAHVINAAGKFHQGPSFQSYEDLRNIIAKRKVAFTRGFVEHLIEYALGRPYGFTDDELSEKVVASAKTQGFRIDKMIQSLVASKEFQTK